MYVHVSVTWRHIGDDIVCPIDHLLFQKNLRHSYNAQHRGFGIVNTTHNFNILGSKPTTVMIFFLYQVPYHLENKGKLPDITIA